MMHMKKWVLAGIAILAVAAITIPEFKDKVRQKEGPTASPVNSTTSGSLSDAGFSFGITELSRDGKIVLFTIPRDAHALEKKADAVVLSGLYDSGKAKSGECPVVQSTAVSKTVENYNPITGKAHVKALFDDEALARSAIEQGCLLINDP